MTNLEKQLRDALEDSIEIAYSNDAHGILDLQCEGKRLSSYVDLIDKIDKENGND